MRRGGEREEWVEEGKGRMGTYSGEAFVGMKRRGSQLDEGV